MFIDADPSGLEAFDAELAKVGLVGQWKGERTLEMAIGGPTPAGLPCIWHWDDLYPRLLRACEVLPESRTARRALAVVNPGLARGATHTLASSIQIIRPGEVAWAHRHSLSAVRFIIQGDPDAYTVVGGDICPMETHDLILTPNWSWHDHNNPKGKHVIWMDALDVGIVSSLNQVFYEPYGEASQPTRSGLGRSGSGVALLRPTDEGREGREYPRRYPWTDVESRLSALAGTAGNPYEGLALEYASPTGAVGTLPTMSCWVQQLRPGESTKPHRRTSSHVYFVVRGHGKTYVGETELAWGPQDIFVIPNWMWHHHTNVAADSDAILFSANDIPTLEALGLYREEPESSLRGGAGPGAPPAR